MRAIQITETGGPEVLRLAELPDPSPGPGELLVELAAAGVNYIDTYHRSGAYPMPLPFLMEPANHAVKTRDWRGITRTYLEMPYGERYIWGITAGILRNLYERIYRA